MAENEKDTLEQLKYAKFWGTATFSKVYLMKAGEVYQEKRIRHFEETLPPKK